MYGEKHTNHYRMVHCDWNVVLFKLNKKRETKCGIVACFTRRCRVFRISFIFLWKDLSQAQIGWKIGEIHIRLKRVSMIMWTAMMKPTKTRDWCMTVYFYLVRLFYLFDEHWYCWVFMEISKTNRRTIMINIFIIPNIWIQKHFLDSCRKKLYLLWEPCMVQVKIRGKKTGLTNIDRIFINIGI